MIRFWFQFHNNNLPMGVTMGCGVTAHTYQDALSLLQEKVFGNEPIPEIKSCVENIDVSTLDTGHILLNMRPPNLRGIWYPIGYE